MCKSKVQQNLPEMCCRNGKKELYINGVKCTEMDKKTFIDPETREVIIVKGNYLANIKLEKLSGYLYLKKNGAFEWIFIGLSFLVMLMALFLLSGAIGGGLGGVLAVGAAYFNTAILLSKQNKIVKGILCSLVIVASCVIWWLFYSFIVALMFL